MHWNWGGWINFTVLQLPEITLITCSVFTFPMLESISPTTCLWTSLIPEHNAICKYWLHTGLHCKQFIPCRPQFPYCFQVLFIAGDKPMKLNLKQHGTKFDYLQTELYTLLWVIFPENSTSRYFLQIIKIAADKAPGVVWKGIADGLECRVKLKRGLL